MGIEIVPRRVVWLALAFEPKGTHTICLSVLAGLGLPHASEQDAINVRYVCECVSRRAAHLVSAGAACLINKMDFEHVTVAYDLMLSEDGSGRGAALVAAVACRDR
ncbi:hypothetical protein M8J75_003879 [Diaphorina citri]|nr:hypothetical protein M8J75_003879 [Diaphorina citri]